MARERVCENHSQKNSPLRCFIMGLGRGRCPRPENKSGARVLAGKQFLAHKPEGVACGNQYGTKPCKRRGDNSFVCGQSSGLCIPQERRGKETSFQQNAKTIPHVVPHQKHKGNSQPCANKRNACGFPKSVASGQRGLLSLQRSVSVSNNKLPKSHQTNGGHVCKSRECQVEKICLSMAPLASLGVRRFANGPSKCFTMLRQPTMESNSSMVAKVASKQAYYMPHGSTLLGWKLMVAPTSQAAREGDPGFSNQTSLGAFHKLPRRGDASYKVAPSLLDVIRKTLEDKQVQATYITSYLNDTKSLERYNHAFKVLWSWALREGLDPSSLTIDDVAGLIRSLDKVSTVEARMAYSAMLLVPGYDHLRFHPFLKVCKRLWNVSAIKYANVWSV